MLSSIASALGLMTSWPRRKSLRRMWQMMRRGILKSPLSRSKSSSSVSLLFFFFSCLWLAFLYLLLIFLLTSWSPTAAHGPGGWRQLGLDNYGVVVEGLCPNTSSMRTNHCKNSRAKKVQTVQETSWSCYSVQWHSCSPPVQAGSSLVFLVCVRVVKSAYNTLLWASVACKNHRLHCFGLVFKKRNMDAY